jgi:hypothetical protein
MICEKAPPAQARDDVRLKEAIHEVEEENGVT